MSSLPISESLESKNWDTSGSLYLVCDTNTHLSLGLLALKTLLFFVCIKD